MPSYPLLCLAAQYSQRVYTKPAGKEREAHVDANWKMGTKAMVIKSVPVDDMNTIVFALRGSQTFMDWAVNVNSAPVSPGEFLVSRFCFVAFHSIRLRMLWFPRNRRGKRPSFYRTTSTLPKKVPLGKRLPYSELYRPPSSFDSAANTWTNTSLLG